MASEVVISGALTITPPGGRMNSFDLAQVANMPSNGGYIENRQNFAVANQNVPLNVGNVTLPLGRAVFTNRGPGNLTIQAGPNGTPFARIAANSTEQFLLANNTPCVVPDLANTSLDYALASR